MTDTFSDTTPADLLNEVRKHIAENKAGSTSESSPSPLYRLSQDDSISVSDDIILNGNKHEFADSINISDSVTQPTALASGSFQITDDAGGGTGVTQPGKIEFADCG